METQMTYNDKNYKEEMAGIETNSEIMLVYLGSPLSHDLTDVVIKRIIVNRLIFDYLSKKNTDRNILFSFAALNFFYFG